MGEKIELKDHVIICGYGVVGETIADMLHSKGIPFIVIEMDPKIIETLKELNYNTIYGDATISKTLKQASIEKAKAIAIVMDNDAKDLFTVLVARDFNSKIFISTRANDQFVREKLIEAGADYVVLPQRSASREIINELTKGQ